MKRFGLAKTLLVAAALSLAALLSNGCSQPRRSMSVAPAPSAAVATVSVGSPAAGL